MLAVMEVASIISGNEEKPVSGWTNIATCILNREQHYFGIAHGSCEKAASKSMNLVMNFQ